MRLICAAVHFRPKITMSELMQLIWGAKCKVKNCVFLSCFWCQIAYLVNHAIWQFAILHS